MLKTDSNNLVYYRLFHNLYSIWWLSLWFGSEQRMQRCSKDRTATVIRISLPIPENIWYNKKVKNFWRSWTTFSCRLSCIFRLYIKQHRNQQDL